LLQSTWETAVLLNGLEDNILSIPFLSHDFDNEQIKILNEVKKYVMRTTYLTTQILKCFLLHKKNIFLTAKKMPTWFTGYSNKNMGEITNITNIYERFPIETINSMYNDIETWLNNNKLSKSYKKVDIANKHYNCFLYFYDYFKKIDYKKIDNNNLIYIKFKLKMKKEYKFI
jgi:hypothetical protein